MTRLLYFRKKETLERESTHYCLHLICRMSVFVCCVQICVVYFLEIVFFSLMKDCAGRKRKFIYRKVVLFFPLKKSLWASCCVLLDMLHFCFVKIFFSVMFCSIR